MIGLESRYFSRVSSSVGHEPFAGFFAFGAQNGFTAFTLGFHLIFHGVTDFFGWQNVLQFNTVDFDTPGIGGHIQE